MKHCDRGLENAARGRRIFKSEVTVFTIWTDPKPVTNSFFSSLSNEKKNQGKKSRKPYCDRGQRQENPDRAKDQSDCRIRQSARLGKKN